jgi:hypothetical protein
VPLRAPAGGKSHPDHKRRLTARGRAGLRRSIILCRWSRSAAIPFSSEPMALDPANCGPAWARCNKSKGARPANPKSRPRARTRPRRAQAALRIAPDPGDSLALYIKRVA